MSLLPLSTMDSQSQLPILALALIPAPFLPPPPLPSGFTLLWVALSGVGVFIPGAVQGWSGSAFVLSQLSSSGGLSPVEGTQWRVETKFLQERRRNQSHLFLDGSTVAGGMRGEHLPLLLAEQPHSKRKFFGFSSHKFLVVLSDDVGWRHLKRKDVKKPRLDKHPMSQGFSLKYFHGSTAPGSVGKGGKMLDLPLDQNPKSGDSLLGWLLVPRTSEGRELQAAVLCSGWVPRGRVKASSVSAGGGSRVDPQPFQGCSHHAKPCGPLTRCLHLLHPGSARPIPPSQS